MPSNAAVQQAVQPAHARRDRRAHLELSLPWSIIFNGAFSSGDRHQISGQAWLVASKSTGRNLDLDNKPYTAAEDETPDEPVTGTIIVPVTNCRGFGNVAIGQSISRDRPQGAGQCERIPETILRFATTLRQFAGSWNGWTSTVCGYEGCLYS